MGYRSVHNRLADERGKASDHKCSCGAQAEHWAYQYTGVQQIDEQGRAYSENVADYEPMCRSCHFRLDTAKSPKRAASFAEWQKTLHTPQAVERMRAGLTGKTRSETALANYRRAWTPERRARFAEQIRQAHRDGKYTYD